MEEIAKEADLEAQGLHIHLDGGIGNQEKQRNLERRNEDTTPGELLVVQRSP